MNFADQKTVKKLRKEFPVGCRIVLDEMDDRQAPPIGTQGTCNGVDDAGFRSSVSGMHIRKHWITRQRRMCSSSFV